ncbi:uncharacterized protein Z518_11241 [Rhinocladiella mackenziei CBS 650.93]|uniref:Uncharacterized protein n=1 Tax=Rhinocladiella mackenziei CBS 650.93 TaxID=1442369 RepID=A0A0D2GMD2_9EURO|nr:uncharacterized protein Z518_11241 [Rhinocladiella mackenziei CBS 650.93]KIW99502.1 hypothetical protein Z518_11241 [Rhinocladiella mackenziei CBS 650.93]
MAASTARGEKSSAMKGNPSVLTASTSVCLAILHRRNFPWGPLTPRLLPEPTTASTELNHASFHAVEEDDHGGTGHSVLDGADAHVELLLHFTSCTAQSLAGSDKDDHPIVKFWAHNVPRLGLSHHFVLDLTLAVAGYHLAYLRAGEGRQQDYEALAERHMAAGLAEMTKVLPNLDDNNCGALYVSAVLVCYCAFAAGSTSPDDLLLCNIRDENPVRWLPLIHGVRLIRTTADPAILFSGLMAPLDESNGPSPDPGPTFARECFSRIEWEKPLYELRSYIASYGGPDVDVYLRAFDTLSLIYKATYGKADGSHGGPPENQFILGWLYRMEDSFVACLRRKEPLALLLLAHYALLFRTMGKRWYMRGWCDHLLVRIRDFLGEDFVTWLRWPMQQAGVGVEQKPHFMNYGADDIFQLS